MNGPDALGGVRRGVRSMLPETGAETVASADQDTAAGTIPAAATGSGFPGGAGRCEPGPRGPWPESSGRAGNRRTGRRNGPPTVPHGSR